MYRYPLTENENDTTAKGVGSHYFSKFSLNKQFEENATRDRNILLSCAVLGSLG